MSLKLIGSILVSLVGIFSAFELTRYHKKRVSTLDGIISLIFYVKGQVECYSRPISAILSTLPPRIARECNCQGGIECLEDVADGSDIYLDEECARIFDAFAAEFGQSFREEQVRRCDHYASLLGERRIAVESRARADSRACGALTVSAAVCLAILLW
jgi:hypothetical protein